MRTVLMLGVSLFVLAAVIDAQKPPLLPEENVAALANELSGETAKRNLGGIARCHMRRGSQGFQDAAVLVSEQRGAVQDLAVGKFGAAGIVSYAQNQKTAWWGEDENLIRWGHLQTFSSNKTFAFMVSLKTVRGMKERLARGEQIRLRTVVKAGQHPGFYEVVTPPIPCSHAPFQDEDISVAFHPAHPI